MTTDLRTVNPTVAPASALVVVSVTVCLAATLVQSNHIGLDGPALVMLASRAVGSLAAAALVGCLLLSLWLGGRPALATACSGWALLWVMCLLVGLAVDLLTSGAGGHSGTGPSAADQEAHLRWSVVGTSLAALVRVLAGTVERSADLRLVLGVVLVALSTATVTGHAGSTTAAVLLLAHVLAATAWVGGLIAIVLHGQALWRSGAGPAAVRAYSRLALLCFLVLSVSGVLGLAARTGPAALLERRDYLLLLAVKLLLLVVLALAGAYQRRVWLHRLETDGRVGFLVLGSGELVLMAAALGLAATLSHTAS